MKITYKIKKWIFVVIRHKTVNVLLRSLLKPFLPLISPHTIHRVPFVGQVSLPLPNSKVLILTSDGSDPTASELYWSGLNSYEPETINLYFQLLKHAQVVFDIGANVGLFTLLAALDCQEREVHTFEPVPKIFKYLTKNIEINNLHNVKPLCGAVTNYDGEIPLYIPRSVAVPTGASTLKGFKEADETIIVPALTIDTYVSTNNIARVDLLKIDTEGTEPHVLEGAKIVLARDKPMIICEVLKGLTGTLLHSILDNTDYKFFFVSDKGLIHKEKIEGDETYKYRNYLFITTDKISKVLQGQYSIT